MSARCEAIKWLGTEMGPAGLRGLPFTRKGGGLTRESSFPAHCNRPCPPRCCEECGARLAALCDEHQLGLFTRCFRHPLPPPPPPPPLKTE